MKEWKCVSCKVISLMMLLILLKVNTFGLSTFKGIETTSLILLYETQNGKGSFIINFCLLGAEINPSIVKYFKLQSVNRYYLFSRFSFYSWKFIELPNYRVV